jgi:hypothetical protein
MVAQDAHDGTEIMTRHRRRDVMLDFTLTNM